MDRNIEDDSDRGSSLLVSGVLMRPSVLGEV